MTSSAQKQASTDRRAANRARGDRRGYPRVRARPIFCDRRGKITRRCHGRRFLLAPDDAGEIANFIGYCLAYVANKYNIEVHASVWMSNHHHTDITDPDGNLVPFKQLLHSMIARGLNVLRRRNDSFWSGDPACDTRRPSDDESLDDLVYTLTNPVKAGLVKWSDQWPGFTTVGWKFGETRTFERPAWFFDKGGSMPARVQLTLARPRIFNDLDDEKLYKKLEDAIRSRERKIQEQMRQKGRRFMGRSKLAKQRWNRTPQSHEERFHIKPRVAASNKWLVLAELQRDRDWERAYAEARALMLDKKPAVFPAGTYWLRRFVGVAVAGQPP
ncbi:MAG: hypothetical protein KC431_12630 [Myxococcales bacterium]|nr:hypothetical protein [Myxococcales bacterium]